MHHPDISSELPGMTGCVSVVRPLDQMEVGTITFDPRAQGLCVHRHQDANFCADVREAHATISPLDQMFLSLSDAYAWLMQTPHLPVLASIPDLMDLGPIASRDGIEGPTLWSLPGHMEGGSKAPLARYHLRGVLRYSAHLQPDIDALAGYPFHHAIVGLLMQDEGETSNVHGFLGKDPDPDYQGVSLFLNTHGGYRSGGCFPQPGRLLRTTDVILKSLAERDFVSIPRTCSAHAEAAAQRAHMQTEAACTEFTERWHSSRTCILRHIEARL